MAQLIFERIEQKYLLSTEQYTAFQRYFHNKLVADSYGKHTICNIYFDTQDYALIRASLEKPVYKEKLRLRSYGIPKQDSKVFVELKKKFKKTVYKRRQEMTYQEAERYLWQGEAVTHPTQITQELDYFREYHRPVPAAYISYDRVAYQGVEDPELRVTFDQNILARGSSLSLQKGIWGTPLLQQGQILMEIKIHGAMPLEWAHGMSELGIYPTSFSKYGRWYQYHRPTTLKMGGIDCV